MPLVSLRNVQLAFGTEPVLDAVTWHLGEGERISLLGRNGAGKSSLLRVIAGQLAPDAGVVERKQGLRVGLLEQELPSSATEAQQVVFAGVRERPDEPEAGRRVEEVLSRLELAPGDRFATLSAGTRRRVLLGRALIDDPDLLLLDEPTNHLDIEAIGWLEDFLARHTGTVLFVTHDRALLGRLASRVIELELGKLHDFPGSYERFVQRKQAALHAAERADRQLDKKLASEEVWVRGGLKARRIAATKVTRRRRATTAGDHWWALVLAGFDSRRLHHCSRFEPCLVAAQGRSDRRERLCGKAATSGKGPAHLDGGLAGEPTVDDDY